MTRERTKDAAEALLRELPSVIGACVREDIYGHPREVHLLVRSGPNPRHLAYDVRDLLEERLGIPVDQRVISIAQLARGRRPGPLLAERAGFATPVDAGARAGTPAPADVPDAAPAAEPSAPADAAGEADAGGDLAAAVAAPRQPERMDARVLFTGLATEAFDNRMRVRVSLELDGTEHRGEGVGLDTGPARLRSAAAATLNAIDGTCVGRARFEVEHVTLVQAFDRDYALVTVLASSPYLGRRPITLSGAHPVELDAESAAVLSTLKAINRTLSLVLRLADTGPPRPRGRPRAR